MATKSNIEWTDHTFNPWRGCTKVSDGCKHCYAEALSKQNPKTLGVWGPRGHRAIAAESYWREPVKWNRAAAEANQRHRVFCASLADVFEGPATMPDESWAAVLVARARLLVTIHETQHLDWLLLTKRPECVDDRLREIAAVVPDEDYGPMAAIIARRWRDGNPPDNLWLGTSIEDQPTADARHEHLRRCPAAVRFYSAEPLIGPIDRLPLDGISWLIVGGESGPNARPMHPDWPRSLRDQCRDAGVPFFFKQWGEWWPCNPVPGGLVPPGTLHRFPDGQTLVRLGKHWSGRLLDGLPHDEFPPAGGGELMAWSPKQRQLYARACQGAGLSEEHRHLLLRQVGSRAMHDGRVTSTSPRLTQSDFEEAMAIVERHSGGQVKIRDSKGRYVFGLTYWQVAAESGGRDRLRELALRLDQHLQLLLPEQWAQDGEGLAGWIKSRVTSGRTHRLKELSYQELQDLIHGIKAFARRHDVPLDPGRRAAELEEAIMTPSTPPRPPREEGSTREVRRAIVAALQRRRDRRRPGELPRPISAMALARLFKVREGGSRDSRRRGVRLLIQALRDEDGVPVLSRGSGYYLGVDPADYEAAERFAKANGLGHLARAAAIRRSPERPTPRSSLDCSHEPRHRSTLCRRRGRRGSGRLPAAGSRDL